MYNFLPVKGCVEKGKKKKNEQKPWCSELLVLAFFHRFVIFLFHSVRH